jgi:hypothetical protein
MKCRFLFAPLIVLSAGCATPPFPDGIPTAMIRFTANVPVIVGVPCKNDKFVRGGLIKNPYTREVSPVKMHGTRSDKNNEVIERLIPAERTLHFRVLWGHGAVDGSTIRLTQCIVAFSFRPQPHEQYQADYLLGANSCDVKVYRLSAQNGAIQKTQIPVKRHPEAETASIVCPSDT